MERGGGGEDEDARLTPSQLLQLAETHLRVRNFSLCRQYALESQQPSDPHRHQNHRNAAQLLAVADILSTASSSFPTNYYSILQVDTFCDDLNLIRSQFRKLVLILDPIKDKFPLANEAVNFVWKAFKCLTDSTQKSQLDSQISQNINGDVEGDDCFWTFCPYCFYMYQYARVYEGCCLRCQNETCRRAFHGVSLTSLPRMELDKGQYFSCFGYFPLGFSASECEGKGKFASWSPIVGMFPVKRIAKTRAGRIDLNDNDNDNDDDDNVQIFDETDDSEVPIYENEQEVRGENFEGNVGFNMEMPNSGANAVRPQMMKRKSVAWNAKKLMSRRRRSNEGGDDGYGVNEDEVYGFEDTHDVGGGSGCGLDPDDMAFFEEDGEIFVGFGPDDAF